MSDLIKREDAINSIYKLKKTVIKHDVLSYRDGLSDALEIVQDLPSADRPQGAWIEMGQNEDGTHNVKCNQCDSAYKMRGHAKSISTKLKYRFCPHCGARMKGADDE